MTELLTAIFNTGGILPLFTFVSLLINLGLAGLLFKLLKTRNKIPETSKLSNVKNDLEKILSSSIISKAEMENLMSSVSSEHLTQVEKMLEHIKNELQLIAVNENQPIREMLLKISAAIELLAKAIEYATKRDTADTLSDRRN